MTLSVCIITNRATTLRRALNSVKFADEVILVATGNYGAIRDIANEFDNVRYYGKSFYKYFIKNWKLKKIFLFPNARNYSLDRATMDWILILDSDEWVDNPEQIKKLMSTPDIIAWRLDQISLIDKTEIAILQTRLWRNGYGIKYDMLVHETVDECLKNLRYEKTDVRIYHDGFGDKTKDKEKSQRIIDAYEYENHPYKTYYLGIAYLQMKDENPDLYFQKGIDYLEQSLNVPAIPAHLKAHTLDLLADCYRMTALFYRKLAEERIVASVNMVKEQNLAYLVKAQLLKDYNLKIQAKELLKQLRKRDTMKTGIHSDRLLTRKELDKEISECMR